jgi:transcriptional regulator with XRE-family HTH domain
MDLKVFKAKNNLRNKDIANELGIDKDYFSSILNNKLTPSSKVIGKIIDLSKGKIDANYFFKKTLKKYKK